MRSLAIMCCLLFMYVENAYTKDVEQQAPQNTETNIKAEVDAEDPLRDIMDLLRLKDLDKIPGEYKIIARNRDPVIKPGKAMSIEIYITGYGQIEQNKIAIYQSQDVIDCTKKKKPGNDGFVTSGCDSNTFEPEFLAGQMYPSIENKESSKKNVGSEKKKETEYKSYILYQYSGDKKYKFHELGVVRTMPDIYFKPDKLRLRELKKIDGYQCAIKTNFLKIAPRICSEICFNEIAPIRLNLKTKKDVLPGNYSIDIYFTYFNGKEWRVAEKQVGFKVQNIFERFYIGITIAGFITAIIGSIAAFLVIRNHIRQSKTTTKST